jgi:hypothetical protein
VLQFRTVGREEKGLAHLVVLLVGKVPNEDLGTGTLRRCLCCRVAAPPSALRRSASAGTPRRLDTAPPLPQGRHSASVAVTMTSDNRAYFSRNLKDMLSSAQDLITGVLQYYNSLFKIPSE